ncbi:hypothetical protein BDV59DRAFT_176884 [Aspergillus ambiguus]|uniref:uncharacterized protein n=1 Tax=Aspergillus ambiguus TaxID=176160 RepID=UPI003CCD891A
MLSSVIILFFGATLAKPLIARDVTESPSPTPTPTYTSSDIPTDCSSSTSNQWLHICNTTIFWPTSTDYFYGPTEGPEASVVSCNAAWIEHDARATELHSLGPTSTFLYYESVLTSQGACETSVFPEGWDDIHTGPVTTLCDGIPRALGPRESITRYYPGTGPCTYSSKTYTRTSTLYYEPDDEPSCSLNTQECIPIWSTYKSLSSSYRASITATIPGDTNSPIEPEACPSTKRNYTVEDPCTACHYLPNTATMFYWPVTTVNGDLCLQNGSTIPATPTGDGPNTAVVDGNTFISPTIYVSFTSIYARSNQRVHPGGPCGGDHVNAIISVDPADISSYRSHRNAKYPTIGTQYPFNFADFQPQVIGNYTQTVVPAPQYLGGSQCPLYQTCTIIRDDYVPYMEIPDVMTQIDPRWTQCDRSWYIPPVSLVPLGVELESQPTNAAHASIGSSLPAVPESGAAVPTPEATGW